MTTAKSKPRTRSGSETRRRDKRLLVRLDDRELTEIEAGASAAGLTLASFARARILANPAKPSRRATPDMALLAQILGQLGRVGSNINQIARGLNGGDMRGLDDLPLALAEFRGTASLILRALGMRPDADHH